MNKLNLLVIAALVSVLASCGTASDYSGNRATGAVSKAEPRVIEVTDKDRVQCTSKGWCSSRYLVYAVDGTYEITDTLLNLRFNSSDLYGKIRRDRCYSVTIDGLSFRAPYLSMYENLLTADEVPCPTKR